MTSINGAGNQRRSRVDLELCMSSRKRVSLLEHAAILFIVAILGALALANMGGCNVIGGLGRDLSAWADGGATEASENAAAIRNK